MKILPTKRRAWAEVDLDAIRHNFSQIKKSTGPTVKMLVAVKANAYGHGLIDVSKALVKCGVNYFGVGTVDEAAALRQAHIEIPILNLTSITKDEIEPVIDYKVIQTVPDLELARAINEIAKKKNTVARVHLKVDTGMGRLGIWHNEAVDFIKKSLELKNIVIGGIFTHFASADEDPMSTRIQIKNFVSLLNKLKNFGINIRYKHAANSAATINFKSSHFNIIRPGIMIYGLYPNERLRKAIKLKPALAFKSRITSIKIVPEGRSISYGATYITRKDTKIAIVSAGYGDGYNRLLSNRGTVLINGKRVAVLGRVCMDQIMVDITRLRNVSIGNEVVLIGSQGTEKIYTEDIAKACHTIPYEVTCWISQRVPRIYF